MSMAGNGNRERLGRSPMIVPVLLPLVAGALMLLLDERRRT